MSTEAIQQQSADVDEAAASPTSVAPPNERERRRPRLNVAALGLGGDGERKRGKSMFGVLVNTLNKAKAENKERNASDAAKKRQLIDQRLQTKLRKETDTVRQIEDAKKDRVSANRKEEEWQMKDSLAKLRRKRLPLLANFLSTSDIIRDGDEDMSNADELQASFLLPPRSHPAPLYYLPAKLLPEQETFINKRKQKASEVAEKEWEEFKEQRAAAVEEITMLRRKVAEADASADTQQRENGSEPSGRNRPEDEVKDGPKDVDMDVDDDGKEAMKRPQESEKQDGAPPVDEDDAVEY